MTIKLFDCVTLDQAREQGLIPWQDELPELGSYWYKVYRDAYPVTQGHLLFVPTYDNSIAVQHAFEQAYILGKKLCDSGAIQGFNIGMNLGHAAGQTVMYPHIHLIPRYAGDCADPVGGVRGVIPGQANYRTDQYTKPQCS